MKTKIFIFLFLLLPGGFFLAAQTRLPDSKRQSSELYIYKASAGSLRKLNLKDLSPDETMLQSFVTSYDRNDTIPPLPRGNYFIVGAEGNQLVFSDHVVDNIYFKLVPDKRFRLCLYDSTGRIIRHAKVKYGARRIRFDPITETYHCRKAKDEKVVEVNNNGVFHYIEIEHNARLYAQNNFFKKGLWRMRRQWYALRGDIDYLFHPDHRPTKMKYTGFIVFNKPVYKPGETVKMKAYMTGISGRLYDKPLNIRLYANYPVKMDTTLVKNLSPYRPGMFQYEFKLTGDLNLKLDNNYTLALKTDKEKDNELNSSFRYEEYELKSTRFTVETKKQEYAAGDTVVIKVKATDENEMALYGGKVELLVTPDPGTFGVKSMNNEHTTFIPDVLWTETIEMNEVAEKEITVPDSIFPAGVSLFYYVRCTYLSADNEKREQTKKLFRNANDHLIDFSLEKGILTIKELYKGIPQQTPATIHFLDEYGIADSSSASSLLLPFDNSRFSGDDAVSLPCRIAVPWFAASVEVQTDHAQGVYSFEDVLEEQLGYQFYRLHDSVYLKVDNPAQIPFWYTLRKNNKEISKGYTTQLDHAVRDNGRDGYGMQLSYIFGKERHIENALPQYKKNMTMDVSTPTAVYPGQQTTVTVSVADKKGKPVENADITAYAFTSKFQNKATPSLTVKGKSRYAKPFMNRAYKIDENGIYNQKSSLSWPHWQHAMSLDTIEYYKFLYPDIYYSYSEPSADGTTQIAPYVVINGALQGVHLLWIDDRLHFAAQAQQYPNYLFRVTPGAHKLQFRTYNRDITVYDVVVKEGMKTILSFNVEETPPHMGMNGEYPRVVSKLLDKKQHGLFSQKEIDYLSTQLITIDNNFGRLNFLGKTIKSLDLPVCLTAGNINYFLNPIARTQFDNTLRAQVNRPILAGPFPYCHTINGMPDMINVSVNRKPLTAIPFEGGYHYTVYDDFLKIKKWDKSPVSKQAGKFVPPVDFNARFIHEEDIHNYFKNRIIQMLSNGSDLFSDKINWNVEKKFYNRLKLFLGVDRDGAPLKPALILIVPQDKRDVARHVSTDCGLYTGDTRNFSDLREGMMTVHLIFGDTTSYSTTTPIFRSGLNYLKIDSIGRNDDNSMAIIAFNLFEQYLGITTPQNPYAITTKDATPERATSVSTVQQTTMFLSDNQLDGGITGTVMESSGEVIVGAYVTVKGKILGAMTDTEGRFRLRGATAGDMIEVNYLGYKPTVVNYEEGYDYKIVLKEDVQRLDDVVVMGYGAGRRLGLMGTVYNIVSPRPADIAELSENEKAAIMMRGTAGMDESNAPLIIVNGLPYDGTMADFDPSTIISMNLLKDKSAVSIYGARAANGVIMIQTNAPITKKQKNEYETIDYSNSMRRNFHDDAFWQPALKTNKKGVAKFEVTYPDDITNWHAQFLAIGNRKQTDNKQINIHSFKALTARLSVPRFAIRGDSLNAVGRIANHLNDTIEVRQIITFEGGRKQESPVRLSTSHVTQIPVTVTDGDSVTLAYSFTLPNGYFDGEERSFPVFEPGLLQSSGSFKVINDTATLTFDVNPDLGPVTIHAEASSLEVFRREIDKIDHYPYYCNEQMASKIKALLAKKTLSALLNEPFKEDEKIRNLITRLYNNRNSYGMWGWWNKSNTEGWITHQVINALLDAEKAGFNTGINTENLCTGLERELKEGIASIPLLVSYDSVTVKQELLNRLVLLKKLNAPIDFPAYLSLINSPASFNSPFSSVPFSLRLKEMELYALLGMNEKINTDTLLHYARHTMLGSLYWDTNKNTPKTFTFQSLSADNIENTLTAYTILRHLGGHEKELEKIRNYFFECRQDATWQNTYQASRIIETIMQDMLDRNTGISEVTLYITNDSCDTNPLRAINKRVTTFPHTGKIHTNQPVQIRKEGAFPLFVTVYQQAWNPDPAPESSKGFTVKTQCHGDGEIDIADFNANRAYLTAGKPAILEVSVTVADDADYVQIEVPIPAGCSYETKPAGYYGKEAHREHFKEKVTIFCNRLNKGEHRFTIELIPRFSGKYTLNPAKAELMYFPVFYGNEMIKTITTD